MSVAKTNRSSDGRLALAISTMVVRVLRDHTGRGPTKSRTHLTDDLISVVVQDTLTHAEHTLVANGKTDVVLTARRAFHDTMRDELVAGIEELTGRSVVAFFSDNAIDPDVALKSFLLAPQVAGEADPRD
jgi:uncharacterized protein YbcI